MSFLRPSYKDRVNVHCSWHCRQLHVWLRDQYLYLHFVFRLLYTMKILDHPIFPQESNNRQLERPGVIHLAVSFGSDSASPRDTRPTGNDGGDSSRSEVRIRSVIPPLLVFCVVCCSCDPDDTDNRPCLTRAHTQLRLHTHTSEPLWSSSPQQVHSPLLQGNMKSKTFGVCRSKWCDLQ